MSGLLPVGCVKRAIAREAYTSLTCTQAAPVVEVDGNDLARERKARGITMGTAAEELGTYPHGYPISRRRSVR